jgi:hypothetical protein
MDTPNRDPDSLSPEFSENLREAARALERAETAAPLEVQLDASQAEKLVVRMRNELIEQVRKDPTGPRSLQLKRLLDRVNGVLSIIVGVEYPSSFVHREMITQARDALQAILADER